MSNNSVRWYLRRSISPNTLRFSLSYVGFLIIIVCISFPFLPSTGAQLGVLFGLLACCLIGNFIAVKYLSGHENRQDALDPLPVTLGMTIISGDNQPQSQLTSIQTQTTNQLSVFIPEEKPPEYIDPPSYNEVILNSTTSSQANDGTNKA